MPAIFFFQKSDKNDEPVKTANGDLIAPFNATPSLTRPERHATTRRAVAKCSMVFRVCSSSLLLFCSWQGLVSREFEL